MIDLKNPKWEDFHIIEANQREVKPGERVRCGLYRAKPGCSKPDNSQVRVTQMPKEWYNEFFRFEFRSVRPAIQFFEFDHGLWFLKGYE